MSDFDLYRALRTYLDLGEQYSRTEKARGSLMQYEVDNFKKLEDKLIVELIKAVIERAGK